MFMESTNAIIFVHISKINYLYLCHENESVVLTFYEIVHLDNLIITFTEDSFMTRLAKGMENIA